MSRNDNGIVRLGGKDYHTVAKRIADFRAAHPLDDGWGIITKPITVTEEVVMFRASIVDPSRREVAVGYAEERRTKGRGVNATSAVENCESSAVGRALAAAGYVGSGNYASADEVLAARARREATPTEDAPAPSGGRMLTEADWQEFGEAIREDMALDLADVRAYISNTPAYPLPTTMTALKGLYNWLDGDDGGSGVVREWAAGQRQPATPASPGGVPVPESFTDEHDPSWAAERVSFCTAIQRDTGTSYEALAGWLEGHGFPRPSHTPRAWREALYKWLRYGGGSEVISAAQAAK